jgi:transposase
MSDLLEHAGKIEDRLSEYDRAIGEIARADKRSRRLMQLRGIGPTTASALLASIGAGHDFRNGRQVAAWLGLRPGSDGESWRQAGSLQSLGEKPNRASRLLAGGCGDCRQKCTDGLGNAEVR